MTLFFILLSIVASLFGFYYIQLIFFSLVSRFDWFFPLSTGLPFETMIYLFIVSLLLMAAITYLMRDDEAIITLLLLLSIPWFILLPLWFIPSVPLFLFLMFLHQQQHPARYPMGILVVGYVITPWSPLLGYAVLVGGWGYLANSLWVTKKRRI
jgi:hypothetical protein